MDDGKLEDIKAYIAEIMEIGLNGIEYEQHFDSNAHKFKFHLNTKLKITDEAVKDLPLEDILKKISLAKFKFLKDEKIIITTGS